MEGWSMVNRPRLVIPVVAALLWLPVPAQASHNEAACPDGTRCIWDQTDFRGRRGQVPETGCIDATIRSAINESDGVLEFFRGAGCYGLRAGTLGPGEQTSQISAGSATGDCSLGPADQCSDEPPSP
ncbi:MAG TPA: peptidase inhibitor family I36 protein [Acidimicrobiia bacterium]|jgi:hypothetical protein|nr:peptidase inhibitor family I36 protein [Acidimicrobiia bacterium]